MEHPLRNYEAVFQYVKPLINFIGHLPPERQHQFVTELVDDIVAHSKKGNGLIPSTRHFERRPRNPEDCEEFIAEAMDDEQNSGFRRSQFERPLDEIKPVALKKGEDGSIIFEVLVLKAAAFTDPVFYP